MRSVLLSLIAALVLPLSLLAENQVKITKDIPFATFGDRTLKIDLHMPQGVENPPLVMFIHGCLGALHWVPLVHAQFKIFTSLLQNVHTSTLPLVLENFLVKLPNYETFRKLS